MALKHLFSLNLLFLARMTARPDSLARTKPDGTVVADFSAGPGAREIKFAEVSITPGAPVKIARFQILPDGSWPERPDYYDTHPRAGFPMPAVP